MFQKCLFETTTRFEINTVYRIMGHEYLPTNGEGYPMSNGTMHLSVIVVVLSFPFMNITADFFNFLIYKVNSHDNTLTI